MNVFSDTQSNGLISVCIKKKTGYEPALAEALGWTAIDERLYDAVKTDGSKIEFKKQSGLQWFDLVKLSEYADGNENIEILWFMHVGGSVQSVYSCSYADLIASKGITQTQLDATRLYAQMTDGLQIQIKFPIHKKMIKSFTLVWER